MPKCILGWGLESRGILVRCGETFLREAGPGDFMPVAYVVCVLLVDVQTVGAHTHTHIVNHVICNFVNLQY